jgi:hypothetical protein
LATNSAGGLVEYKVFSENMPAGVNEAFHRSTPSNEGDEI